MPRRSKFALEEEQSYEKNSHYAKKLHNYELQIMDYELKSLLLPSKPESKN